MRFAWYAGASTALAASVIISAFHQRANFYSAMVYLSQSNLCLIILTNWSFLIYSSLMYGLQRLCYGQLRPIEVEQLYEKAWFAVTETCLAMTIFRDEIGAWFVVMFTALVTGKVWGWIGDGRVEVLEQQPPTNPRLFHTRLSVSLVLSIMYDIWLLSYAVNTVILQARPNMMVMFLFEFAILAVCSFHTAFRYLLSVAENRIVKSQTRQRLDDRRRQVREQRVETERRREAGETTEAENAEPLPNEEDVDEMDIEVPGWESKGQWVLSLDLFADFLKLGIYGAFFFVLLTFYGLPIHIMRDLFITARSFVKRLGALLRYRRAVQDMNKYQDATEEDLNREDTCIICREEMQPWDPTDLQAVERTRPKKLPCGHILHLGCLKSWLERQQVCPTCRRSVVLDQPAGAGDRQVLMGRMGLGGAAADGQAPRPNGPAPDGQAGLQPPPNGGVRMFNLGPIRLGFAQARVHNMQELAQRMGMPPDMVNPPQAQGQAPAPAQPPVQAPGQAAGTQHQHQGAADGLPSWMSLRQQVLEVDQRIQHEMQHLQNMQHEMQMLQLLVQELARLRQLQDEPHNMQPVPGMAPPAGAPNPPPQLGIPPQAHLHHPAPLPPWAAPLPHQPNFAARMNNPAVTRHTAAANAIPAGSAELPEGVVIPPGWSLLPLQRMDGQAGPPSNPAQPNSAQTEGSQPHPSAATPHAGSNAAATGDGPAPEAPRTDPAAPSTSRAPHASAAGAGTASASAHGAGSAWPDPRQPPMAAPEHTQAIPITAPTPVMPNWGGTSQLFANRTPTPGQTPPPPPPQPAGPGEGQADAPPAEEGGGEAGPAGPSAHRSNGRADGGGGVDAKGKAKAATVEEADDDEEE